MTFRAASVGIVRRENITESMLVMGVVDFSSEVFEETGPTLVARATGRETAPLTRFTEISVDLVDSRGALTQT